MTFLPIVQRELQVAARRVATYRLRVLVAAAAGTAAVLPMYFSSFSPSTAGSVLFAVLAWGAFGFCHFEGLRIASDSLAEEKREGTLGLLFLTDLRGYDVVLGKFASAAVRSFTALLASLPIFALPLLMGGVTGGEFWRVMLALLAVLLVALTAGLCVSAATRSGLGAMGGTALLLGFILIAAYGLGDALGAFVSGPLGVFRTAFEGTYGFEPSRFWWALAGNGLLAAALLLTAGFLLARFWRDEGSVKSNSWLARLVRPRVGTSAAWGGQSAEESPAEWLGERLLPGRRLLWSLMGVAALVCFAGGWIGGSAGVSMVGFVAIVYGALVKLWMAMITPLSLNEARRSGALEILLSTPLQPAALVRGQIDALTGYFFGPAVTSLVVFIISGLIGAWCGGNAKDFDQLITIGVITWFLWFLTFLLDMYALAYTGLWLGLTELRPGIASAKTVVYVLVIPWVTMIVPLVGCMGLIAWPIFWMVWSSRKLDRRFRTEVARQFTTETGRSGWWPF